MQEAVCEHCGAVYPIPQGLPGGMQCVCEHRAFAIREKEVLAVHL